MMTAAVPACELVELCRSLVEMVEPSAQTPPVLEVVAPLSVPMNTPWIAIKGRGWRVVRPDPARGGWRRARRSHARGMVAGSLVSGHCGRVKS